MSADHAAAERANPWHAYWRGQATEQVLPPNHPGAGALDSFWTALLDARLVRGHARDVVDLASGGGEVAERVQRAAAGSGITLNLVCVDIAEAALQRLAARLPGARTLVANVSTPPLPEQSQDLVVSQFGIEYAGREAFVAAGRLVRPGGALAAVVHHAGSGIHRECVDNESAAEAIIDAALLPAMHEYFERLGAPGVTGPQRESSERRVRRAARSLEQVVRARGASGAGGALVSRLFKDCAQLFGRAEHYEPAEVLAWTDGMMAEVYAYRDRMRSMQSAALDGPAVEALADALRAGDMTVVRAEAMVTASGDPVAWILEAERPVD